MSANRGMKRWFGAVGTATLFIALAALPLYAAEGGGSAETGGRKAGGESGVRKAGGESGTRKAGGESGARKAGGESGVRKAGGESGARKAGGETGARKSGGESGSPRTNAETGTTMRSSTEKGASAAEGAQQRVDQRQENQERRIERGITKGYLTEDEIARLKAQQDAIGQLEASLAGDGQLTKDEAAQFRKSLKDASLLIWTEKHDQEGSVMPVYRLGKDVSLKANVAQKLEDPNLTREEARAFTRDFHRTVQIKRTLGTANLTEQDRAKLQTEYDALMAKYFEIKPAI